MPTDKKDASRFVRSVYRASNQFETTIPKVLIDRLKENQIPISGTFKLYAEDYDIKLILEITDNPECLDCGEIMNEDFTRGSPAYKWRCPKCGTFESDTEIRLENEYRKKEEA